MSHMVIIINARTPEPAAGASVAEITARPPHDISVTYVPPDTFTPVQVGHEVARIQRHVNKILGIEPEVSA